MGKNARQRSPSSAAAAAWLFCACVTEARADDRTDSASVELGVSGATREHDGATEGDLPPGVDGARYYRRIDEALVLRAKGELREAAASLREAHSLYPTARTYRALGVVSAELGLLEEAAALLGSALTCGVRPLTPELRAATEAMLARVRAQLADARSAQPAALSSPTPTVPPAPAGDRAAEASGPRVLPRSALAPATTTAVQEQAAPPIGASRPWRRSVWLWSAVGAVVVGGVVAGALSARAAQAPYERGSSGVLVGARP